MHQQADAAVVESLGAAVFRKKRYAVGVEGDAVALGRHFHRYRFLEFGVEGSLGEHVDVLVAYANDLHLAVAGDAGAIVAAQALRPDGETAIIAEMYHHIAGRLVIGPLARAMDDDAFAAVLRDPECRRIALGEEVCAVDPGQPPEIAVASRALQRQLRRAIPPDIVDK